MSSDAAREYAKRFAKLQTNKNKKYWTELTKNQAPHKPLLLLSVLDLFEQGVITSNFIEESTPELDEMFNRYWMRVLPLDRLGNLELPFFYLRSEGFWELVPRPGKEEALNVVSQIGSRSGLRELVLGARLEECLHGLLVSQKSRDLLRSVLVETYFAPEVKDGLVEQGAVNREAFLYSKELLERGGDQAFRETLEREREYSVAARDQGFRRAVVTAYTHRCALCGLRVRTLDGHTVVEAAHIVPWSEHQDDRPANGLALCRTCHWAFDEGLAGISQEREILVSAQLQSKDNFPGYLGNLESEPLVQPSKEAYRPDPKSLEWHRKNVFASI